MPELQRALRRVQGDLKLLRFWFTSADPVSRRSYLEHGLALALLKYVVDVGLIWAVLGLLWTPADYVRVGVSLDHSRLAGAPTWLSVTLAFWTAPFFWIGLSLSARRARGAGISAWFAQLFFVPFLNYVFMAVMCALPDRVKEPSPRAPGVVTPQNREWAIRLRAMGLGTAAGVGLTLLGVQLANSYGGFLFFGVPFVIGAVTAYAYNRSMPVTSGETMTVVLATLVLIGLATISFAIEGLICLVMAFPFAWMIAIMGAWFGRWMALGEDMDSPVRAALGLLLLPAAAPFLNDRAPSQLHEVRSVVEIDAAPSVVWRNVVSFPRLDPPKDMMFRTGVAYPIGARIVGEGVGAVRYCDFSTGSFEEPITHWEPGVRLSFDIVKNPAPMREWSPYAIHPPHLDGYFNARRGEFRLVALPNGRTRLEGNTWYELRMGPEVYWALYADAIVERIHTRVLEHIERLSEVTGPLD